jgi:hypothetical protein
VGEFVEMPSMTEFFFFKLTKPDSSVEVGLKNKKILINLVVPQPWELKKYYFCLTGSLHR